MNHYLIPQFYFSFQHVFENVQYFPGVPLTRLDEETFKDKVFEFCSETVKNIQNLEKSAFSDIFSVQWNSLRRKIDGRKNNAKMPISQLGQKEQEKRKEQPKRKEIAEKDAGEDVDMKDTAKAAEVQQGSINDSVDEKDVVMKENQEQRTKE